MLLFPNSWLTNSVIRQRICGKTLTFGAEIDGRHCENRIEYEIKDKMLHESEIDCHADSEFFNIALFRSITA